MNKRNKFKRNKIGEVRYFPKARPTNMSKTNKRIHRRKGETNMGANQATKTSPRPNRPIQPNLFLQRARARSNTHTHTHTHTHDRKWKPVSTLSLTWIIRWLRWCRSFAFVFILARLSRLWKGGGEKQKYNVKYTVPPPWCPPSAHTITPANFTVRVVFTVFSFCSWPEWRVFWVHNTSLCDLFSVTASSYPAVGSYGRIYYSPIWWEHELKRSPFNV